jgi:anthraniloyl-CoA monooxygenase
MKIVCLGGGPAGLYFALLMKRSRPECDVVVHERNGPDDAFGWGVVFSDETLDGFREADPESFEEIRRKFVSWTDIETYLGEERTRSTGHGFCGVARKTLLQILQRRCEKVGVDLKFHSEVRSLKDVPKADLVVAADGVNSLIRAERADAFRPRVRQGACRFIWLGTTLRMDAFTFVFQKTEHGVFAVHAYPFQNEPEGLGTWIVECHEDVWRRAGLEGVEREDACRYFEKVFRDRLRGAKLLDNKSVWRVFPEVVCESWRADEVVLLGDAAHTAHFSIGSGTKLAMEDAIALRDAFVGRPEKDVRGALAAYEEARRPGASRLQRVAKTSQEWFENVDRYMDQHPTRFTFNLMTRSRRITYDNLKLRDPALIENVDRFCAAEAGAPAVESERPPRPMFQPIRFRGLELHNRVVVSPMCQYSADDGLPNDWHLVHLGGMAKGGAALVMAEATAVLPQGRITYGCTGVWSDAHTEAWRRVVRFVHERTSAKIGLQLAHAGRKASCSKPWEGDRPLSPPLAWPTIGPSNVPFRAGDPPPSAATRADMDAIVEALVAAVRRAEAAKFDLVELHFAHGYLFSSFLSPKANFRDDAYGGSLENRMRFPLEAFSAARAAWPSNKPMFVRISASDWLDDEGGFTVGEAAIFSRRLKDLGCDAIDVSSAGNTPESKVDYGRMYQTGFADRIRHEAAIPVIAVGAVQSPDHVDTIVAAGRADLCAIARGHLVDPHFTMRAAIADGYADLPWPSQYAAVKPRKKS